MVLHPSNYYAHTYTHLQHKLSVDNVDILTYTPYACRLPLPKRKFKGSFDPSWHLPSPSRCQQPSFAPPSTCAFQCPPSPANPHMPNRSPFLTSAVSSSTQVCHSSLSAPSSALSSSLPRPSSTFPTFMPYLPLAPCCSLSLPSPLPSTFSCYPMYSLHHPPAPFRLLPEFHVPLASAESAKDVINWYKIHPVVSYST
jgi:hypothetical protein